MKAELKNVYELSTSKKEVPSKKAKTKMLMKSLKSPTNKAKCSPIHTCELSLAELMLTV